jgi:hypothetical protein
MYNPPAAGGWASDDLEFLELKNTGPSRLQLGSLSFTAGVSFTFANGASLDPGQFLVLVRNAAAFRSQHPGVLVHGTYTGRLDNGGETLRLVAASAKTVFEVTYADNAPWPAAADGQGRSLQRQVATVNGNDPTDWVAAFPTPGADQLADADHDSLPDAWERAYGLNPANPADRDLDSDGDGMSNWQEYAAATDPTNPASRLQIDAVVVTDGTQTILRFRASAGQGYTVEFTDALSAGTWTRLADVAARSWDREETIADAPLRPRRFYRLITPPKP